MLSNNQTKIAKRFIKKISKQTILMCQLLIFTNLRQYNMAATLVFSMTNNFTQSNQVGICTCSALHWAKKSLKLKRGLKSYTELPNEQAMNAQMAVLRKLDNKPAEQCELVGLATVGHDRIISSIQELTRLVKSTAPHIAIFWTQNHTMGYRYAHNEKEFFDVESGLYRAKTTKDIQAKMEKQIQAYGQVKGVRIVKLP
jgi:hypothetical protein